MRRAPRSRGALLLLALVATVPLPGCGTGAPRVRVPPQLGQWAEGPVRWLLLPSEWRRLRRISDHAEAIRFIEGFWWRRDPDPAVPGNPARQTFLERVDAADVLYAEESVRGSLTDRGRVLVLLGPPSHLEVGSEPTLAWDPRTESRVKLTSKHRVVEEWGYRMDDLSAGLLEVAREDARERGEALILTVKFVSDPRGTRVVEGEILLELAARALVLR